MKPAPPGPSRGWLVPTVAAEPRAAESLRLYPSSEDHPGHEARWFERLEDGTFEGHEYRLGADGTLKTGHEGAHLADFVYRLHYTAGLPSSFGIYVLGIVSMIYGLAIVTGLLIFLPNFLKDLFIVRPGRNNKRFWRDAHNVVGVVSLPWHVMFAWSSVLLTNSPQKCTSGSALAKHPLAVSPLPRQH